MGNRIEVLRSSIDKLVGAESQGGSWFVESHLFAVSNFAAMIALKRGLDPEIATMIGLLHDIHTLLTGDPENHAKQGSILARKILGGLDIVTDDERDAICTAIRNHSKKRTIHDAYSELAKDADVLSHYFYNTTLPVFEKDQARLEALREEFELFPEGV